jgi:pimeloyl-ACP methyl ester carboxylesterase
MNYQTVFNFIDNNQDKTYVFLPGWATDYRIFSDFSKNCNWLIPEEFYPRDCREKLYQIIKNKRIKKISLIGFSLGGFVGQEFAAAYPQVIEQLILISCRNEYPLSGLTVIEQYLRKNKDAYLYKFYRQCFYSREEFTWFNQNLLPSYFKKFNLEYLLTALDYFKNSRLIPAKLKQYFPITIIHGCQDKIAPYQEINSLIKSISRIEIFSLKNCGHVPFVNQEFKQIWNNRENL